MSFRDLRQGREAIIISLAVTLVTALMIFLAVWLVTQNIPASLLLAAIATATDPAATLDVMRQTGSRGPLTRVVAQVVAIDDAWGAILFSILLVVAERLSGNGANLIETLGYGLYEVVGALVLGVALGLPMAWLTGRLKPGEPMLLESAGFVFLAAGIAGALEVSYLLTCMTLGVVVANRARHHVRPFRSIDVFLPGGIRAGLGTITYLGHSGRGVRYCPDSRSGSRRLRGRSSGRLRAAGAKP